MNHWTKIIFSIQKDDQKPKVEKSKKTDAVQPDDQDDVEEEEVEMDGAEEPDERPISRPASKLDLEEPLVSSSSVDEEEADENADEQVNLLWFRESFTKIFNENSFRSRWRDRFQRRVLGNENHEKNNNLFLSIEITKNWKQLLSYIAKFHKSAYFFD